MSKHKQEKHSDFQELVADIRAAENEADRVKSDYDSKISELLKKGREKSVELRESYDKKAAEVKNRILSLERHKTEKLADSTIADAKKEAAKVRSTKLDKKSMKAVFDSFVSSL